MEIGLIEENREKIFKYINRGNNVYNKEFKFCSEKLKIDNSLPKIKLPKNKINMFIKWFNEDIINQIEIPKVFSNGYIYIENNFLELDFNNENLKNEIKKVAKEENTTYRNAENAYKRINDNSKEIIVHYYFEKDKVFFNMYCDSKQFFIIRLDNIEKEYPKCKIEDKIIEVDIDNIGRILSYNCLAISICILWYLATTKQLTKYKYEVPRYNPENVESMENKRIIETKSKKVITTPIYDLKKVRIVNVDKLIQRRKGWTYSHAFEVHGHYRHYSNGKVIFISSFIKGKGKKIKPQELIINAKEL